ncbi:MAG: valine--tRNA ligase [Ignavibacteriae bacterium]|nr:valine--tRNA ligase [Ignavibacteria bacterium]MBI3363728.1 valine--tRNA ligase [Ignavibacteriota bacterium]
MAELPKAYVPKDAEDKWYPFWEERGFFHATVNPQKKPFTVVIPPPNITGILTMGHVLNNTIQDVFVRWKRMQGYETLWMPGTDHAGIATQNVVEKSLSKEGKTRHDLGREEFLRRVWQWKEQYGGTIIKQLRKLGTSCDWVRERFTMDEGLSEAVQEIFIRLYEKGLIYRGKYIVNWCPKDHTAISDDEVNFTEQQSNLWYVRYPIKGTKDFAVVATTRPETMLGDTAVAVHPNDERYKHLIGKMVFLPLTDREIPIIADDVIDPEFGTGMVKVTPAHDPNDYWIGERHNAGIGQRHHMIPINIFDISARLNDNVPPKYRGMDRFDARKEAVKDLEAQGFLVKIEPHVHNVGRCYRCDTIIEPYLSDQWFVKMKPLAGPALRVVENGTITFHPKRWVKTYEHWMTNIRDWCISRQLWWGHRIPVWYCVGDDHCMLECKQPIVSRTKPAKCPHCNSTNLRQDEDVLDTWFSSWLWPFSTLGWPKANPDLRYFYPTDTLVTAPDIIFFWVARMIMAGMEVMNQIPLPDGSTRTNDENLVPFKDVYFTSIIRDMKGRKMSKSLGNSPDPLDVIAEYGADALRFTIVYLAPLGQDVLYSNEKCEIGRNFANKIWNAGRFLMMNKDQLGMTDATHIAHRISHISDLHLDLADRWILSRLHSTIAGFNHAMTEFEINHASKIVYDFVWHDFCDWYVEMIKGRLYGDEPNDVKQVILSRAISVFDQSLRLLHPFMPFVTEELWQHIESRAPGQSIMVSAFPVKEEKWIDKKAEEEMAFVQSTIESIRNVRGELSVPPSKDIQIIISFPEKSKAAIIQKYQSYFQRLARVTKIEQLLNGEKPKQAASAVVEGGEVFIPLEGLIDLNTERQRIQKELTHVQGMVESIQKKLANESFVSKAPKDVVEKEREKLESFRTNMEKLQTNLRRLFS